MVTFSGQPAVTIFGKTYTWKNREQMKKDLMIWVSNNLSKADIRS